MDASDPETRLLRCAGLLYVWQRAGQKAPETGFPELTVAPTETRPVCSPVYGDLLKKIFSTPAFFGPVTTYLVQKIDEKQLVVPPEYLVLLLNWATTGNNKKNSPEIRRIAGERGAWLARQNPDWEHIIEQPAAQKWQDGTAAERIQYLIHLRQTDPEQSAALMERAWAGESLRERREWLRMLLSTPSSEELDFVARVYDALLTEKGKLSSGQLELRHLAASILLGSPETRLCRETVAALAPYFQRQTKLMGLQQSCKIKLPAGEDTFFQASRMVQALGLEAVSPYIGCSEPEYWCCALIGMLHPVIWEQLVDPDWHKILELFDAHSTDTGKKQWPLLQSLSRALAQTRYTPGIEAYLKKYPVDATNVAMLQSLTTEALETWFCRQQVSEQAGLARTVLTRPGWLWSYALSKQVLKSLLQEDNISHHAEYAKVACLHFHPGVMADLETLQRQETHRWQQHQQQKLLIGPLLRLLQLRTEIDQAK